MGDAVISALHGRGYRYRIDIKGKSDPIAFILLKLQQLFGKAITTCTAYLDRPEIIQSHNNTN